MLAAGEVVMHPFVIGELACGSLPKRAEVLSDLQLLSVAAKASDDDVLRMIELRRLWNKGVGWIDCHLLAAALLANARLWTLDRSLAGVAKTLGIAT